MAISRTEAGRARGSARCDNLGGHLSGVLGVVHELVLPQRGQKMPTGQHDTVDCSYLLWTLLVQSQHIRVKICQCPSQ